MGAAVEHVGCSAAVGAAARCVAARRRSLAHGGSVGDVAAGRAVVRVASGCVRAVAVGDDGAELLAGISVGTREAHGEAGYVGEGAGGAAAAHAGADN